MEACTVILLELVRATFSKHLKALERSGPKLLGHEPFLIQGGLSFRPVAIIAALALLFRLPQGLLALLVLSFFGSIPLLPRVACSTPSSDRLLLSRDRGIDCRRRRATPGAHRAGVDGWWRTPCPRRVGARSHLLHLDVTALLGEECEDFSPHFFDSLALSAAVDHRLKTVHRFVRPQDTCVELFKRQGYSLFLLLQDICDQVSGSCQSLAQGGRRSLFQRLKPAL